MYRSTCNAETFQPVSPGAAGPGCASTLPYMSLETMNGQAPHGWEKP